MRESAAQLLATIANAAKVFHAPDEKCYANIMVNTHEEVWPVRSRRFKAWLASAFYQDQAKPPPTQAMKEAVALVEARALHGPEQAVYVRVAEHHNKIYVDLADHAWRVVQIDATGWRVIQKAPVAFVRAGGMLALPEPAAGGTLDTLRRFLNVEDEHTWRVIFHWLAMTFQPRGPYPPLGVHGEQGSGKSTGARVLRELVDPNAAPLRSEPREPRDLMIAAEHGWVIALDNLSHLPAWLSDALCRLSTGGGFATRELYSDSDEIIFNSMRPVILTGIEEVVTRGDLMDRTIIVELPIIASDRRRAEGEFWHTFEQERPGMFGALLDAVAAGLRAEPEVKLSEVPRMADFARWSVAVERRLGLPDGGFMDTYTKNIASAHELVLDGSPVALTVRTLVADGKWEGTVAELLATLAGKVDEDTRRTKGWPKTSRGLSGALRRLAPDLRAVGVGVTFLPRTNQGRPIRLAAVKVGKPPSQPSQPTPTPDSEPIPAAPRAGRDGRDGHFPTLTGHPVPPRGDLWGVEEGEV